MSCSCDNNPLILPVGATGPQGPQGPKGDPGTPAFQHYIGESFGGGVVFHVYRDALGVERGLIASIINQDLAKDVYSNIDNVACGALSTWDGQSNTNLIKTQAGPSGSGAWKLCDDYTVTVGSTTYNDWYLPSVDELNLLYNNRFNTNKTLATLVGANQLVYESYWTSSEYSAASAFVFSFQFGTSNYNGPKGFLYNVRAIRKF